MKHFLLLSLFLCSLTQMDAQREETLFSDLDLTGFWFATSHNFSGYEDDWGLVRGWSLNFEFGRDLNLGWGWYNLKDDMQVGDERAVFDLKYNGILFNVSPNAYKAVHPRLSFLLGRGKADINGEGRDRVFVFQPSGGVEFNVVSWMRIGLEGGYRFIGGSSFESVTNGDISSPFVQLDLRFGFSWY